MTVLVTPLSEDQHGRERWQFRSTLGQGHRVGVRYSEEEARKAGERAERHLLAVEEHDPDEIERAANATGQTILRAPDGTIVEVPDKVVESLIAAGYTEADGEIPQRTGDTVGPVEVGVEPKRRGRQPTPRPAITAESADDEME